MSYITISTESKESYSLISNHFIDYYMTKANGEFVKVYLYLVRLLSSKSPISVADIADHFNLTEKDICRAIRYWIKEDVLRLEYDASGALIGITLLPLPKKDDDTDASLSLDSISLLKFPESGVYGKETRSKIHAALSKTPDAPKKNAPEFPEKSPYSIALHEKARSDETFLDIEFEVQTYFQQPLSQKDIESLIYIHDQLGFPYDIMEYLIEYCVSIDKCSMRYAEAVAKAWYKDGVKTLDEAKERAINPLYRSVFKALGINRKAPSEQESKLINSWHKEMAFDIPIIIEACNQGLAKHPHDVTLAYVNGILKSWKKQGVKTLNDIEKVEAAHREAKKHESTQKQNQYNVKANAFNSFQQTDMSAELDEMEQLFLDEINSPRKTERIGSA